MIERILLFTDFGPAGPYVGQLRMALQTPNRRAEVIELLSDAPAVRPRSAAYLLAALAEVTPGNSLFLGVVDPGVGGARRGLVVRAGQRWFVGPDNGLLAVVAARAEECEAWHITWRPPRLSSTFHGRDLFAPVAARLAQGEAVPGEPIDPRSLVGSDWAADLPEIIYLDHFGNGFTGLRPGILEPGAKLEVGGHQLTRAKTFSEVPVGTPFWYEGSCGLVEIAVNQGRADQHLSLSIGDPVTVVMTPDP